MSSSLSVADYVAVAIMLALSASVGLYFRFTGGRQKTTLEYLMGDNNMGILPVSFSLMVTSYSAITILGVPAETYFYGMQRVVAEIGYTMGSLVASYLIVPVYFDSKVSTIFQYLGQRFGKTLMVTTSFLYSIQMILYMPIVLYAPSLALSLVTELSVWSSVLSMGIVCTFYSVTGGFKAVLWADVIQSMFMFFVMYSLLIKGSVDSGGIGEALMVAGEGQRLEIFNTSMDLTVRYTLWNSLAEGFALGIYLHGTTFSQVQRLLSTGTVEKAQKSLWWNILLSAFFRVPSCLLGIVMYAYYKDCDPLSSGRDRIISADQLVPLFILTMFGHLPGLPGVCVAGILGGSLSTVSSYVNSLVAVTIEDYIKPIIKHKNIKESTLTLLAKALALFYGGFCLFMTYLMANTKGVIEGCVVVVGMIGGPTLGAFCLGMFTLRANETGTLIGLVCGFAFHAWMGFGSLFNASKYPPLPLSTAGCTTDEYSVYSNETTMLQTISVNSSCTTCGIIEDEKYVFPLYKVSFFWFSLWSTSTTIILGYILSIIFGMNQKHIKINPLHMSPVVRKWLCNSSKSNREYVEVIKDTKEVDEDDEAMLRKEHEYQNLSENSKV